MAKLNNNVLTKEDEAWIDTNFKLVERGIDIAETASNDALEYLKDVMENLGDKQWRKMSLDQHAIEMGVGSAFAAVGVNKIYNTMHKHFTKKAKLTDDDARMVADIYIGRVVQNIVKELNNEAKLRG